MATPEVTLRDAIDSDLDPLARLWCDGWHDAHAAIVPAGLVQARTLPRFRERLQPRLDRVRVAAHAGSVAGLALIEGDELDQFYVAAAARGTAVAPTLMRDALERFRRAGIATPWLSCAVGNDRAARFYEKAGWRRARVFTSELPTPDSVFVIDSWRYEIDVAP